MKMTQRQFEKKCYEAYQLDWMISHGHSLKDYRDEITSLVGMTIEENPLDIPSNEDDMQTLITEAEDAFQDTGFDSRCLFVCEDEFLDAEYLDPDYMEHLLSNMFDSENCKSLWQEFTGLELPNQVCLKSDKCYILPIKEGYLEATISPDETHPGIDIEYVSDKESEVPGDKMLTRPRVLIEKNDDKLRAVIWSNPHYEDYTEKITFSCVEDMTK